MPRFRLFGVPLAALFLAGCGDARRDAARDYLQTHAPAGFAVVAVPETLPVHEVSADSATLITPVRYRSTAATVEVRDGFALPAAQAVDKRLAELRGWALSSLPADAPRRARFLTAISQARAPFPVKRIVTPAGTEVDAVTTLSLRRAAGRWQVTEMKSDAAVPGAPDADPRIPPEYSAEAAARVAELASVADQLDAERREYLAARKAAAERSAARLRSLVRTGRTFTATFPDGSGARFVVTRGFESAEPPIVVLTVQGEEQATARFGGAPEQTAAGEMVWRAAQVTTLARPATAPLPAAVDAARHPVLLIRADDSGLTASLAADGLPARTLDLHPAGTVELLPEASSQ